MTESKSSANSFGTFLKTMQEGSSETRKGGDPTELLGMILRQRGALDREELRRSAGLEIDVFDEAIARMHASGFVDLIGPAGRETVSLTAFGNRMAASLG